ncbi:DUF2635 domain-containing protein [Snodgrassella sp. CFCC 13594]|uniref:DUF2635 domain-containing protein n=1 Tax=Snodgrassella sp. CFCC 13594 TaxID=1775559 RepID=UPI00082AB68E|nr:DUF2635 domain-containing protein [Snodgrassella sp. CFCC 13594]
MKVKAADGLRVPLEKRVHDYIEDKLVEVSDTVYYRRLLADGDLCLVVDVTEAEAATKTKGAK